MENSIKFAPSYATLFSKISPRETLTAQSGAMISMSSEVKMKTFIPGGFFKGFMRKTFAKESLFMNDFYVESGTGEVVVAPGYPGNIVEYELKTDSPEIFLQPSSFMAKTGDISLDTRFMGFKSFFSGEGTFFLKPYGSGKVFFNSYGDIQKVDVEDEYIVDTGHLVAFESSLDFQIKGFGGVKSTLFSGEGIVMKFSGKGAVYLQSRTMKNLAVWLRPFLSK